MANITREPETEAIMEWTKNNNFILSINLRAGSMLITIPFNEPNISELPTCIESLTYICVKRKLNV